MKNLIVILALVATSISALGGDEIPGASQQQPVVLKNALLFGTPVANAQPQSVVFDKGVVTEIGATVTIPVNARVIDCAGKRVYPGFIAPHTTIGLTEVDAVRSTRDMVETGVFNPNARAETAYNPDSEIIPTVRMNGVLVVNSAPYGGIIAGRSSLMRLDGWTREDIAIQPESALLLTWPSMEVSTGRWVSTSADDQRKEINENVQKIYELFTNARAYSVASLAGVDTAQRDIRYEAMRSVFERNLPVMITASTQRQIEAVLDFQSHFQTRVILVDAWDAPRVIPQLQKAGVGVVVPRVHSLPRREEDGYDAAFTLPAILAENNIPFALSDNGSWQQRNLPFLAGTARAFGLSETDAIKALTIWPAMMFGVDAKYGTLEVGKSATLFVSDGDALDTKTNKLMVAFIDGREVDLSSRHTRLARKYRERLQRK
ncbi:MAG: amidohydrolase family protein [Ignavibacteria bacterium]|nr:amidohydrolase family protein [Ignavibacteria bacterium]